jgi:DNA-binding beta-propeller fold protein YncE
MPGPAVRFDYQDVDADHRRLYIAHLGANRVIAVDVDRLTVAGTVDQTASVHGVRVAADLDRVFATATGSDEVVAIQASSLAVTGRVATGRFPDGVAYDPTHKAVFVSNKDDGSETVVDASTLAVRHTLRLAGEVGNVIWDPAEQRMLVAARPPDQLLLDPDTGQVTGRVDLPGCSGAHGVAVDPATHTAFVACERNARLAVVDLRALHQREPQTVGDDPTWWPSTPASAASTWPPKAASWRSSTRREPVCRNRARPSWPAAPTPSPSTRPPTGSSFRWRATVATRSCG